MDNFYKALIGKKSKKKTIFSDLIGEWEIEWIDGKGTENERHVIGEWLFSEILNGEGIQDIFICPSRAERLINPQPDAEYGTTIRVYNPQKQKWDICYSCSGKMIYLEAEKINEEIILVNQDKTKGINHWIFSEITPNTFHWENKSSLDNGKTWIINGEVFAKRRN
ncbi:hypothetical protein [Fusobacterium necrophorum]|uniref:hypothetical protein n=1 Tax=Fusobacterium necrophorum TaxID=859 RepID=UPI000787928E|nr:hypothetical protein [Fusobacterium necrophorum]KYM46585.1 hypothetical protein A2U08_00470 [Fusobacterium necrophorum subsp. funduliforme]RXZ25962.1 hypothetical protein EPT55_09955 [Fusobacterium necrophorum]